MIDQGEVSSLHSRYLWGILCGLMVWLVQIGALIAGESTIRVDRDFSGPLRVGVWLEYYEDASAALTLVEVLDKPFIKSTESVPNFRFTHSAFWSRFTIENTSSEVLELALVHQYVQTDWVELYYEEAGSYRRIMNGDYVTAKDSERTVEYIRSSFRLNVLPGKNVYHVRLKTRGIVQLDFALWSLDSIYRYMPREYLFLACFLGIIFVMSFYNLFLYFNIQDSSYLFYVIFTVSYGFTSIILLGFGNVFFPQFVVLNNEGYLVFAGIAFAASARFSICYLDLKAHRAWYRVGVFIEVWALLATAIAFIHYETAASLAISAGIAVPAYCIMAGYWLTWKRNRNAYFFSLAWTMLVIFSIYRTLGIYGAVEKNLVTEYGQNIGSVMELIILSLGVGDKIRRARRDVARQNAEVQTRLRSALQTRVLIVSNLAHRMNNPLNYIQTGLAGLAKSMDRHRRELLPLLPAEGTRTDAEEQVCQSLVQRLDEMEQFMAQARLGVSRSSQSMSEIRSLSGIDGHHLERLRVQEVVDQAHSRVADFCRPDDMKRLQLRVDDPQNSWIACNRYALSIAFENLFRSILESQSGHCVLELLVRPASSPDHIRLRIQLSGALSFDPSALQVLADLLLAFGIRVLADVDEKSPAFELIIPSDLDKVVLELKAS